MREANLSRLSDLNVAKNRRDYLVMHFLIRDLQHAIQSYAHGSVLDVGCGNKPYETLFQGKVSSYTGCDVIQSDKEKVDVICPATALAFVDEKFDTVFSTQVIEHVEDPFKMLAETNRVLKKGGVLIFSAPFAWELHEEPYDFYRYSKYGIHNMLVRHGFEPIWIQPNGGKWAALVQLYLNTIYSTFSKKTILARLLKLLFIKARFTYILNAFALWLDKKYYDELFTLNYVAVARKV